VSTVEEIESRLGEGSQALDGKTLGRKRMKITVERGGKVKNQVGNAFSQSKLQKQKVRKEGGGGFGFLIKGNATLPINKENKWKGKLEPWGEQRQIRSLNHKRTGRGVIRSIKKGGLRLIWGRGPINRRSG